MAPCKSKELESPILTVHHDDAVGSWWGTDFEAPNMPWACNDVLRKFFRLGRTHEIVFVSKMKADKTTYQVQISPGGVWLQKPKQHVLYDAFSVWLKTQISAGRPHIGVRIIK